MAKFDRAKDKLKARVQFVRGTIRKGAGDHLKSDEIDLMTDEQVEDEITLGRLEITQEKAPAEKGDAAPGGDADGKGK